jgi:hypothetical protein
MTSTESPAATHEQLRRSRGPLVMLLVAVPVLALALLNGVLAWTLLVLALVCLLVVLSLVGATADPKRPAEPVLGRARLPKVRREPPRQVPLIATRCVICGRPLSNRQSMRARVGSTCIKTYGPRYATGPNPDHDRWVHDVARARAEQAAEQARLNGEHQRALAAHPRLVAAWEAELRTPEAMTRRAERAAVQRFTLPALVLVAAPAVGIVLG